MEKNRIIYFWPAHNFYVPLQKFLGFQIMGGGNRHTLDFTHMYPRYVLSLVVVHMSNIFHNIYIFHPRQKWFKNVHLDLFDDERRFWY